MPIVHNDCCINSHKIYEEYVAEFKKKNPKHCVTCSGWGMHVMSYDPSPAGVSLGSGEMLDVDTCPDCIDKELCPLCMRKASRLFDHEDNVLLCTECAWREDDEEHVGVTDAPDCMCYLDLEENYQKV